MILISILFLFICFIIILIIMGNSKFLQGILNLRFPLIMFISSIIHFFLSYIFFGVMFALGEGNSGKSCTFLNVVSSIISFFIIPVVSLVGYGDKIYYNNTRHAFPGFVYFPVAFILNSLLFGLFIAIFLKRLNKG